MTKSKAFVLFLLLSAVLCIGQAPEAAAGTRVIASTDHLPLGDWTYDAMMSLAADGLVPGCSARVFQGDRLFSRMEMAEAVASIVCSSKSRDLVFSQVALINHLVSEFKPELMHLDEDVIKQWTERSTNIALPTGEEAFLSGYVRGLGIDDTGDGSSTKVPYRISGFLNLSSNTFAIATIADKEEKFFHELRESSTPDKVFLRGVDGNFVWSIGREHLSWGPAYSGSLILSDNVRPFLQARGAKEVDFGKLFGRVKITQFVSSFKDEGQTLYLFGRRYEKRLSDRWHAGISETAKVGTMPNPLILVVPFYLYQYMFIDIDEEFNVLCAADVSYRTGGGPEIYGELVIDDVTAPRIFGDRFGRPRKTGYTIGIYIPEVFHGDRPSTFRAEYIFVDRLTYAQTRDDFPELAYTYKGDVIGHPIGRNAKALYLRGEQYLSNRFSVIGEYLNRQQTDPGSPERGQRRVLSLMAAYDIAPDKSIALRVAPYKIIPAAGATQDGTEYELRASLAL